MLALIVPPVACQTPTVSLAVQSTPATVIVDSTFDVVVQVKFSGASGQFLDIGIFDAIVTSCCSNGVQGVFSGSPYACSTMQGGNGLASCEVNLGSISSGAETVNFKLTASSSPTKLTYNAFALMSAFEFTFNAFDEIQYVSFLPKDLQPFSVDVVAPSGTSPTMTATTASTTQSFQMPQTPQSTNSLATSNTLQLVLIIVAVAAIALGALLMHSRRGKQPKGTKAKKAESETKKVEPETKKATIQEIVVVPKICKECGAELRPASELCNKCGTKQP